MTQDTLDYKSNTQFNHFYQTNYSKTHTDLSSMLRKKLLISRGEKYNKEQYDQQ